jgi:hypothetical protein
MKKLVPFLIGLVAIAVGGSASAQQPPQAGGQSNSLPATDPHKTRPKRVHADLSGFELSPKPPAIQVGGGTRGGLPGPVLYAPGRGKSYTTTPSFHWNLSDARNDFKLTVYDSDDKVVYETTVHGTSFTYLASAPALKLGSTYSWTVQLVGTIMAAPAQPVEFVLLTSDERQVIDQGLKSIVGDSLDEQIKRAEIFVNGRLWYDTIEAYTTLIARYPDEADLYNTRGEIYDQIPATRELAEKDFARADYEQAREKKK